MDKIIKNMPADSNAAFSQKPQENLKLGETSDSNTTLLKQQVNMSYAERDALLLFLTKILPSHLCIDESAEEGFQNVVCAHGPTGKMGWHIPNKELSEFSHLPVEANDYDGYSTETKYQRLLDIAPDDFTTTIARHPINGIVLRLHCPMRMNVISIEDFDKMFKGGESIGNTN